jgi:entericidin B
VIDERARRYGEPFLLPFARMMPISSKEQLPNIDEVEPMKLKLLSVALMGALLAATGACNTVDGLGDDIKSVGRAGKRAID